MITYNTLGKIARNHDFILKWIISICFYCCLLVNLVFINKVLLFLSISKMPYKSFEPCFDLFFKLCSFVYSYHLRHDR